MQGYLKKQARDSAYLNMNEFQLRYFFLDISHGVFRYGEQPNSKQKIINVKDILGIELDP